MPLDHGALHLTQIGAQIHDTVNVLDFRGRRRWTAVCATVLRDVDRQVAPAECIPNHANAPVDRFGHTVQPRRSHLRELVEHRHLFEPGGISGRANVCAGIAVESERVERLVDDLHITGLNRGRIRPALLEPEGIVLSCQQRHDDSTVRVGACKRESGGFDVFSRLDDRDERIEILGDRHRAGSRRGGTDCLRRFAMREHRVMAELQPVLLSCHRETWRVRRRIPDAVANLHKCEDLVERHPVRDAVAEAFRHQPRVARKIVGHVAAFPAAVAILQRLRQIPVVERRMRGDAFRQQRVNKAAVEVESLLIDGAAAIRNHTRP